MTYLTAALASHKPALVAQYDATVRGMVQRMTAQLGPTLRNAHNDWTWARSFRQTLQPVMRRDSATAAWSIDEAKLAAAAERFADAAVAAWADKIAAKMGELDGAVVERMDGVAFRITGQRAGRAVAITQEMIVNVSSLGKVFNQFPARIRCDGKAVSEAAYKRIG